MDPLSANVELVFARALEIPAGSGRDEFVARECARDPAVREEVESLLRAHEAAGTFLDGQAGNGACSSERTTAAHPPPATARNAAGHTEEFLRDPKRKTEGQIEGWLATLPEAFRREARERAEAGLLVRELEAMANARFPSQDEPAPILPGFRVERKLGAGGLGVVYAAHDEKLNRRVAVKVLRRRADGAARRRMLEEARKAAAIGDPAIVTIYSVLDETDPPALVMEMVEGYPIDRFAEKLTFEQKARLLREVARGLGVAHDRGMIHRDLKPDNVMVGPDMRPRILDFGLALSFEEAGRHGGGFEGTPLYASPEQVGGRALTAASDVFSFGSLMFKVLTGRPAFEGETAGRVLEAIATTAPPFLREVAVGVPEDLQAICLSCLSWDPESRPTSARVALELGRFLAGEPVRLRPKLYDDLLRRSVSEYSNQARVWESQGIISREEGDALETVHRRLLADEDHWIIEARRITPSQALLSCATWLVVVATVLTVWMLRKDLGPTSRWALPGIFTVTLFGAGWVARRDGEALPAATFLAGAALAVAPCVLALLAEAGLFSIPTTGVRQLFAGSFSNQQALAASLTALAVSAFSLGRLRMTGFAWTTATLAASSYFCALLCFNWLDQNAQSKALWCMPLALIELVALGLERKGRVRWTLPFHLTALLTLVASLDVIALRGPTLRMLGVDGARWPYFDETRLDAFSIVLNGVLFLALTLVTERAPSLDLRRSGKLLEVLAVSHTLSALFMNAMEHRTAAHVRTDVAIYLAAAGVLMVLGSFRSKWRLLVGGLAGCGLGSYLLVELGIVNRKVFISGLGFAGLLVALGTFYIARQRARAQSNPAQPERSRVISR